MPKTIAITPSWYWPESIDRVVGIPPFGIAELCVERHARERPDAAALVTDNETLSFADLHARVLTTRDAVRQKGAAKTILSGALTADNVIRLLAALGAGVHTRLVGPDEDFDAASSAFGADANLADIAVQPAASNVSAESSNGHGFRNPAIAIAGIGPGAGKVVNHSNRSLLAASISLASFLKPQADRAWLAALPLSRWEGLLSVIVPLYLGVPLILCEGGDCEEGDGADFAGAIARHQPGYALWDLAAATLATREQKREVRKVRGTLDAILLSTQGVFNAGDRQRVGKAFGCAALTMFGLAETCAMFVSHPQWYLDEAVGIPLTNAHVVPSDPRNGVPIQTLWELVESAEVTVKGPSLMCGYEGEDAQARFVDGRFRTGVIASSDANGMIYILPG